MCCCEHEAGAKRRGEPSLRYIDLLFDDHKQARVIVRHQRLHFRVIRSFYENAKPLGEKDKFYERFVTP